MIYILFKTAFRNLYKGKWNTLISILGLSIGLAVFILIFSYIRYECSYNKFSHDPEQMYYGKMEVNDDGDIESFVHLTTGVVPLLKASIPEIAYAARHTGRYMIFTVNEEPILEEVLYSDADLFDIIDFDFIHGSAKDMHQKYMAVLTEEKAMKLFGKIDCVGETLLSKGKNPYKVVGIVKKLPHNSDIQSELFVSLESAIDKGMGIESGNFVLGCLMANFRLAPNVDVNKMNTKISEVLNPHYDSTKVVIKLYPFDQFHFVDGENELLSKTLLLYGVIAIVILLLSVFNFINIYTAHAIQRRKSNAMHQIMGSGRFRIALFLIVEGFIISIIAFDVSLLISERVLDYFNMMMSTELPTSFVFHWQFILMVLLIVLITGLLSVMYPLKQVFKFSLVNSIKGVGKRGKGNFILQRSLVGLQFLVTAVIMTLILVVIYQLKFVKTMDIGYKQDHVISCFYDGRGDQDKIDLVRDRLLQIPGVSELSYSSKIPFKGSSRSSVGILDGDSYFRHYVYDVDKHFTDVFGIKVLEGNDFEQCATNSSEAYCIINETSKRILGLDDPINASIQFKKDYAMTVVGVVKDFNPISVNSPIPPVIMVLINEEREKNIGWVNLYYEGANRKEAAATATTAMKGILPMSLFDFTAFTHEILDSGTYNKLGGMEMTYSFFGLIGLLLGLVGVYGLVALNIKLRVKEIGVRKVMGASSKTIFFMVARDYLKMAIIGCMLSWPFAYILAKRFLADYAQHITLNLLFFILPLFVLSALTFATISYHAYRASVSNPIDSLRSE